MGLFKHSESSQNSKLVMPLQYVKEEVSNEVDFLHADKSKVSYKLISAVWTLKFSTK